MGTVPPHWWEEVRGGALKWGAAAALALLVLPMALGAGRPRRGVSAYSGWQYSLSSKSSDAAAEAASWSAGGSGVMGRLGEDSLLENIQDWFIGRTAYSLQQLTTAHVVVKILVLMSFGVPIISAAAIAYQRASGMTYGESLYKCYALVWRVPGIGLAKEPTFESYIVANVVFLVGVFTFAVMLGVVSDEIKQGFRSARNGNYPVRTSNHVLLLNWNSQSPAILRQIAAAQSATGRGGGGALSALLRGAWGGRQQVVILADKPKAEMDAAVFETLRDRGAKLEVHTRQGNPFKLSDLRKVAANSARTILLLHPETSTGSAEAIKAAAAMCLTAMDGPQGQQRVVMQIPSEAPPAQATYLGSLVSTARVVGRDFQVAALPERKIMHRLVAQTAAQPGLFTCWLDILTLHGASPQFVCKPVPPLLAGKPFDDVRRSYLDGVALGFINPSGQVELNPVGTKEVPAGGRLVLLGRNEHTRPQTRSTVYADAASRAAERLQRERTYKSRPRNIIVAGWPDEGVPELMAGFADLTHSGSAVTFILTKEPAEEWPSRQGNCRFNFVVAEGGNPTHTKVLSDAGVKSADTVVVGQGAGVGPELETDAKVLASLMQVQDAVMACKRKGAPHVVAPIRRYATSKLAHQYFDTLLRETQLQVQQLQEQVTGAAAPAPAGGSGGGAGGAAALQAALEKAQAASEAVIRAPEFINTSDVVSAVLTQVVAESSYDSLMRELLFSTKGQELYLRNPASFNIQPGQLITFAELAEAVRLTRQTAVGYIRAGRLAVLAPHATHQLVFGPDDRVVVIAEEF
ncbi:MAG: hypothetical protein J3K34DRAFT_259587 [Monoraphidium minutum]|nr:MAG: hypothetical protein J3K34DRAFT_259587 [Monoraphidium minutum]